jgi:nanoRNase/pAp phosphatase (c-di-AMP/oligoRNAs hydrolase)
VSFVTDILDYVRDAPCLYVQPHNYPDHDGVAAAFGFQRLVTLLGRKAQIVYAGELKRDSLRRMIAELGIDIRHNHDVALSETDPIVVVDGCKGNRNVTDLIGDEVAVIDHHEVVCEDEVPFVDIRPGLGACSTIICGYYRELDMPVPRDVATALAIGINMDTAFLTRRVTEDDMRAYASLFPLVDTRIQNSILHNALQARDLTFYHYAIDHLELHHRTAFCYFPGGCDKNLLGILGDFISALQEVDFVILCARNGTVMNLSVRSERPDWNAALIVQDVLSGIGFGGGHADMAGGVVFDLEAFDAEDLRARFIERLV